MKTSEYSVSGCVGQLITIGQGGSPFDSDIANIRAVELEDRTQDAVVVEGRKR